MISINIVVVVDKKLIVKIRKAKKQFLQNNQSFDFDFIVVLDSTIKIKKVVRIDQLLS